MSDPQPVPLLDLKAQYATIRDEIRAAIDRVANRSIHRRPEVEALEREVADHALPVRHRRLLRHRRPAHRLDGRGHRARATR